ncbi:MAG TPA: MBL fold metallo-hydrolase [Solirubrobacteraceae bacterium]|jgi:glyoxylase-like metal-dependent hydrolase (beta-lactamase superfamily II)|nr:MBL fold metallo-hydrolase [Solirubrobacteraceae bacterium]
MRAIDTLHLGRRRWICCWQVGQVLVDPGPTLSLEHVLAELDGWQPQAILLTHIHFDHAGGTGSLMRRFPEVEVYVHERGAPHMINPERLWASASQLYGEDNMLAMWGEFVPVPEERLHVLSGGETLEIGGDRFEVAYTPGHAKHHVSYLHDGTAFVGDVGGVRIEVDTPTLPPTPPPDIDVEAWHASLDVIRAWRPERLAITHFGAYEQPERQLDELSERLDRWAESAHGQDRETWIATVEDDVRAVVSPEQFDSFMAAVPVDQAYAGLRRYWEKRFG